MLGIISTDEALRKARDAGMDLVEVSPNERPPVCRIMDFGKHKYNQAKKQKQRHHEQKIKEVRLRPKTDPHDKGDVGNLHFSGAGAGGCRHDQREERRFCRRDRG